MFEITELVSDGILSVNFTMLDANRNCRNYTITDIDGNIMVKGKIAGNTQRTSFYVGELKKGTYQFILDETEQRSFKINK